MALSMFDFPLPFCPYKRRIGSVSLGLMRPDDDIDRTCSSEMDRWFLTRNSMSIFLFMGRSRDRFTICQVISQLILMLVLFSLVDNYRGEGNASRC